MRGMNERVNLRTMPAGRVLEYGLIGLAASLPHSLALAQVFAYGSLLCWAWMAVRTRRFPGWHPVLGACFLAFAAVAVTVSLTGPRPELCLPKLHRLVLYLLTFAVAAVPPRAAESALRPALRIALAFALSTAARGAHDLVAFPLSAGRIPPGQAALERVAGERPFNASSTVVRWLMSPGEAAEKRAALDWLMAENRRTHRGPDLEWFFNGMTPAEQDAFVRRLLERVPPPLPRSYAQRLFEQGDMRRPQFYMVALLLLAGGLGGATLARTGRAGRPAAVLLVLAGLLLHFKRGAWLAALAACSWLALLERRWKLLGVAAVVVLVALSLPWTRTRLADLPRQMQAGQGTRHDIWVKAAPALFRAHPGGVGYGGMRREDIASRVPEAEAKQDHLHSNILQMRAELGWTGLGVWVAWMVAALVLAVRAGVWLGRAHPEARAFAHSLAAALSGLLLNGLVEYNFGTGLIRLLFALLLGCILAADRESRKAGLDAPPLSL